MQKKLDAIQVLEMLDGDQLRAELAQLRAREKAVMTLLRAANRRDAPRLLGGLPAKKADEQGG